jgi:hypothetical protein
LLRVLTVLFALCLLSLPSSLAYGRPLGQQHLAAAHPPLRLSLDPAKPLFKVGISGGFTGATMRASVYRDGRVVIIRNGVGNSGTPTESRVPLSVGAVTAVLATAQRRHVLAIPRAAQDAVFGADIPVLSFTLWTNRGQFSVHAMGGEGSHAPGTRAFFPIWNLLYALAGYPPQIH